MSSRMRLIRAVTSVMRDLLVQDMMFAALSVRDQSKKSSPLAGTVSDCIEMYQNGQGENVAFLYQICLRVADETHNPFERGYTMLAIVSVRILLGPPLDERRHKGW